MFIYVATFANSSKNENVKTVFVKDANSKKCDSGLGPISLRKVTRPRQDPDDVVLCGKLWLEAISKIRKGDEILFDYKFFPLPKKKKTG